MNSKTSKVRNSILAIILIVALVAFISGTYARYQSTGTAKAVPVLAKWHVELAGQDISSESKTIDVVLTKDATSNPNVKDDKLAPGSVLSGEFTIDPTGSEVAVDYLLTIGTVQTAGWNTGSALTLSKVEYKLEGTNNPYMNIPVNESVARYSEALADVTSGKEVTFKVYVTWDNVDNANNVADTVNGDAVTQITLPVEIVARQHVDGDPINTAAVSSATGDIAEIAATLSSGDRLTLSENVSYVDSTLYVPNSYKAVVFPDNAVFDLQNNTVTSNNGSIIYSGDNLTIENGTFIGINDNEGRGRVYGLCLYDFEEGSFSDNVLVRNVITPGGITIYGEDVTLENVTSDAVNYYAVYGNANTKLTINSGTYTAGSNALALLGFNSSNSVGDFVINGGTFRTNEKPLFLASGMKAIINGGSFDIDVTSLIDTTNYQCTYNSTTGLYDVTHI